VIYGKLTADASGAAAGRITEALRQHVQHGGSPYRFEIPHAFGWRPELGLSLLESIPGEPAIHRALKQRLRGQAERAGALSPEQMMEKCGMIAAAIHGSGIGIGRSRRLED